MSSTRQIETRLATRWHSLATPYHCRITRDAYLDGIVNRYREEHRHHHTLEHISEMLAIIDEHRDRIEEFDAVAFAVWFHDVIYDPRSNDNESRSGSLARRTLQRLRVPMSIINRTVALIHATHDHEPPDRSFDAALFIDADLAILGADADRYQRYAANIRREYGWLSDDEYRTERRAVLERFMDRPHIYFSDPMRDQLESTARANIAEELASVELQDR